MATAPCPFVTGKGLRRPTPGFLTIGHIVNFVFFVLFVVTLTRLYFIAYFCKSITRGVQSS